MRIVRKFFTAIVKLRYYIITLVLLYSLPNFYLNHSSHLSKIEHTILSYTKQSFLGIAYDGIYLDIYRGIMLYQTEVSSEVYFQESTTFFRAARVYIQLSWWDYLKNNKLEITHIQVHRATFFIHDIQKKKTSHLKKQLQSLVQAKHDIQLIFSNSTVHIMQTSKYHEEHVYIIHDVHGNIHIQPKRLKLTLEYDDPLYGVGQIILEPSIDFTQKIILESSEINPTWLLGIYHVKIKNLLLDHLPHLSDNFRFETGNADIDVTIHIKPRKIDQTVYDMDGSVRLTQVKIMQDNHPYYQVANALLNLKTSYTPLEHTIKINGMIDPYHIHFHIKQNHSEKLDALSYLHIRLQKKSWGTHAIHLPHNILLNGLRQAQLTIKIPDKINKPNILEIGCLLNITDGRLSLSSKKTIIPPFLDKWPILHKLSYLPASYLQLHNVQVNCLEENTIKAHLSLSHKQSDLSANIGGNVKIEYQPIQYIEEALQKDKNISKQEHHIVFQTSLQINSHSNHIDGKDSRHYIQHISKKVNQRIAYEKKHPLFLIPIPYTKLYRTLFQQMQFEWQHTIQNFFYSSNQATEKYQFLFQFKHPRLAINITNNHNSKIKLTWDLSHSSPHMEIINALYLTPEHPLNIYMLTNNILQNQYFNLLMVNSTWKAYGYTLSNLEETKFHKGTASFQGITFSKNFSNKKWLQLDNLQFNFFSRNDNTNLSCFKAQKAGKIFQSYQTYRGKNLRKSLSKIRF